MWNHSAIEVTGFPYPDGYGSHLYIPKDIQLVTLLFLQNNLSYLQMTPSLMLRHKLTESSCKSYKGSTMFLWCQVGGSQQLLERYRRECVVSNGAIKLFFFWHDVQFGVKASLALQSHHRWPIFSNSPRTGSQILATLAATDSKLHRSEKKKRQKSIQSTRRNDSVCQDRVATDVSSHTTGE